MQELKQSTEIKVRVGPFVDVTDGFTPETGITLGAADEAELLKQNGAATTDISAATWAAVTGCDGWYDLTLTTSFTDTLGQITVVIQDDSVCLPVFRDFQIVAANYWDTKYGSDKFDVNTAEISGDSTAADNAESFFDGTGYAGTNNIIPTTTAVTNQVTADVTAISGDSGAADNLEADYDGTGYAKTASTIGTATDVTNQVSADTTAISGDATAADNLELALENGTAGYVASDMKYLDGGAQSATDLKDFADTGYDPLVNKVEGVKLVDTTTANSDMKGTDSALLAANVPTNFSDLAITVTTGRVDVASIEGTDATDQIRDAVVDDATRIDASALNTLSGHAPDNTIADVDDISNLNNVSSADVETACDASLVSIGLDHMMSAAVIGTDVTDNSVVAKLASKSVTADWDTFDNTDDSLEALRDNQTAGGDWSAGEKEQLRDALGVDGTKTAATGGQLQTVDTNVDTIQAVTDNLPNSGALTDIDTGVNNIEAKLPSKNYLAGTANSDGDVELDGATGALAAGAFTNHPDVDLNADQSGVTVGTTTTNTDMRGTDSGLLAASAPTNFGDLAITVTTGKVTVGTNDDKSGYDLNADQSAATVGTVNSTTVTTNNDKTGYDLNADQSGVTVGTVNSSTITTNNDKTGYSLAADQSAVTVGTVTTLTQLAATKSELAAIPAANASMADDIKLMSMATRNGGTATGAVLTLKKDDGSSLGTATLSDDGTTFTRGELS